MTQLSGWLRYCYQGVNMNPASFQSRDTFSAWWSISNGNTVIMQIDLSVHHRHWPACVNLVHVHTSSRNLLASKRYRASIYMGEVAYQALSFVTVLCVTHLYMITGLNLLATICESIWTLTLELTAWWRRELRIIFVLFMFNCRFKILLGYFYVGNCVQYGYRIDKIRIRTDGLVAHGQIS